MTISLALANAESNGDLISLRVDREQIIGTVVNPVYGGDESLTDCATAVRATLSTYLT